PLRGRGTSMESRFLHPWPSLARRLHKGYIVEHGARVVVIATDSLSDARNPWTYEARRSPGIGTPASKSYLSGGHHEEASRCVLCPFPRVHDRCLRRRRR